MDSCLSFTVHRAISGACSVVDLPGDATLEHLREKVTAVLELPSAAFSMIYGGRLIQGEGSETLCELNILPGMQPDVVMMCELVQWKWAISGNPGAVLLSGDRFPSDADELLALLCGRCEDGDCDEQQWGTPVAVNDAGIQELWLIPGALSNLIERGPHSDDLAEKLWALEVELPEFLGDSADASEFKFFTAGLRVGCWASVFFCCLHEPEA